MRLFYATDVHGSERTFRKFVNGAKFYKVDHLVMGGDIMGKFMVPIVDEGGGHYRVTLQEELTHLDGESAVQEVRERIETLGFYHVTVSEDELREMQSDQANVDATFKRLAHERLERWVAMADERLAGTAVKCYVTGGNDDPQDLLDLLDSIAQRARHQLRREDRHPRGRLPDGELRLQQPDALADAAGDRRGACSSSCSRRRSAASRTSRAPSSTCTCRPTTAPSTTAPSSTGPPTRRRRSSSPACPSRRRRAARRCASVVEKYQPLLLLTGHIHESRGLVKVGRTTVINPGSEYGEGILRGCIFTLEPGKVVGYQMTSG